MPGLQQENLGCQPTKCVCALGFVWLLKNSLCIFSFPAYLTLSNSSLLTGQQTGMNSHSIAKWFVGVKPLGFVVNDNIPSLGIKRVYVSREIRE